jgi:hypothetical protein
MAPDKRFRMPLDDRMSMMPPADGFALIMVALTTFAQRSCLPYLASTSSF